MTGFFFILLTATSIGLLGFLALKKLLRRSRIFSWANLPPLFLAKWVTDSAKLESNLKSSGLPLTVRDILLVKTLAIYTIILLLGTLVVFNFPLGALIWIGLAFGYLSVRGPEIYVRLKAKERAHSASRNLPRMIDALLLYVRAGLNLEGAFRELASKFTGLWQKDLQLLVVNLDSGLEFKDALKKLADRFSSEDFRKFLAMLDQSRSLGVPITETLTIQAELLRAKRRQLAEEAARTAAVKISLPLVFFIFPAMLIVFLGPALIQILKLFNS